MASCGFGVSDLHMIICYHIEIIEPHTSILSKDQNGNLINEFLLNDKENTDN